MSKIMKITSESPTPPHKKSQELLMFGLPGVFPELDSLNPVKFGGAFWKPCQNTYPRLVAKF